MRFPLLIWALGAVALNAAPAWAQPIIPTDPILNPQWSPDGTRIGSCDGHQFSVIDASTGTARTIAQSLDHVSESAPCRYTWLPDSQSVLISGPHQIVVLDLVSQLTRTILHSKSNLEAVKLSPDGSWISYVTAGKLDIHPLRQKRPAQRIGNGGTPDALYRNKLGFETAYWWSPDSSAIAILEMAQSSPMPRAGEPLPKVTLHIINLNHHSVNVTLPVGEAYFPQIEWTPDSKNLAIERMERSQMKLDLLLADRATGATKPLLTETDAYWINSDTHSLRFLPDGKHFLWTSERSGFRHIYKYETASGRLAGPLTQGEWAVTSIDSIDSTNVYFTATKQSSIERHVYRTKLDGSGSIEQMTTAPGWHSALFAPSGHGQFLDRHSSATQLPQYSLGSNRIDQTPNQDPLLPAEFSTITTHDGWKLNTMMIRPPSFDPAKKYPALILAPAGPGAQTVRNASDSEEYLWAQSMARQGFIVFAADGRGSGGRGHLFEEPIHFRLGGMELPDQLDALAALRKIGSVDMKRIGIFGQSYAGMIALGAMMHSHGIYKAGLAADPITDWMAVDAFTAERFLGPKTEVAVSYHESSPNEFAKKLEGGLLVIADPKANPVHIDALREELEETKKITNGKAKIEVLDHAALFARATQFFAQALLQ